ncbi:MAG: agmatine deiminase family protein [Anaerolineae bacterium]
MIEFFPLRFNYIPYPLWRRRWPELVKTMAAPLWNSLYPVPEDTRPPQTAAEMADVLVRYRLLPEIDLRTLHNALRHSPAVIESTPDVPALSSSAPGSPLRLPAQWEPMDSVILNWPVMYPPLWDLHAQMVEAIAPVANVILTVPAPMWGHAAWVYLSLRGRMQHCMERVRLFHLPTNDIWVRDHGPIVGYDAQGQRVALDAIYDHLPNYPQKLDDHMPARWAAHMGLPVHPLNLHTEGGNLWTDGAGTLIMTEQVFYENPTHDRQSLEAYLHTLLNFDKLILTPQLEHEETGHVDMLLKLATANTVLVSSPQGSGPNSAVLARALELFRGETNAAGERYTVIELPRPRLYTNWFTFTIHRTYTNSLTINGRVLVPTYGLPEDAQALAIYRQAMPGYDIVPIDCKVGINGGGAVHCMTKEVPRAFSGA